MIYRIYGGGGLGDSWVSISYLLRHFPNSTLSTITKYGNNRREMLQEILDQFNARDKLRLIDQSVNVSLTMQVWNELPLKTVRRWHPGAYKKICYQFDGISNGHIKNPPVSDLGRLTSFVPGYQFIRLGKPMHIPQIVEELTKCDLFLGICSGISHVAHSVGTPVFLVRYRNGIRGWHQRKTYVECNGTEDAIRKVRNFLKV